MKAEPVLTDLFAPLSEEHQTLINVMAAPYLRDGKWATWRHIEHELDLLDLDAQALLRSLPLVGSRAPVGPSYGLASADRTHMASDSRPSLTLAAALHVPELRSLWVQPFLRVLNLMIEILRNTRVDPQEAQPVVITPSDVLSAMPSLSPTFMNRLPELLDHEPPTWGGSRWTDQEGNWTRELTRELLKYRGVTTLDDYVHRVVARINDMAGQYIIAAPEPEEPVTELVLTSQAAYVDELLIKELEEKAATTTWKLDRLLGLIQELNANVEAEHPYSSLAMLRAILDHTPPLFGLGSFDQVASSHPWGRTDKGYMKQLAEARKPADDVLHRMIRQSADVISMADLPPRANVNAYIRGCIDRL